MKKKTLMMGSVLAMLLPLTLASCGNKGGNGGNSGGNNNNSEDDSEVITSNIELDTEEHIDGSKETITMWVGNESVKFYRGVANKFLAEHPDFNFNISITGADTGSVGGVMSNDNTACADIITIAHDNIGKLSQKSLIRPITDESLLKQINDDNPETFKKVIVNKLGTGKEAKEYTFGVPYISQALFLYYNKKFVNAEQAKTFEGLVEAATTANKKAFTITGTDSYNFSFTTLARRESDLHTSVKIYDNFKMSQCFYQGNDTVAVTRWAQDIFNNPNGGLLKYDNGYEMEIGGKDPNVISLIGGAWHFSSVESLMGKGNVGCALIPTFTLSADHVAGLTANELDGNVPQAGDVYRGGTFADCKVFAINMARKTANKQDLPKKDAAIQQILKYFSSRSIQNLSFLNAGNVPAYVGSKAYVDSVKDKLDAAKYEMAVAQIEMAKYGIPQPFRTGILNTYFYSKGCDSIYTDCVANKDGKYNDLNKIREVLYTIEHTWQKGGKPAEGTIPAVLPVDVI